MWLLCKFIYLARRLIQKPIHILKEHGGGDNPGGLKGLKTAPKVVHPLKKLNARVDLCVSSLKAEWARENITWLFEQEATPICGWKDRAILEKVGK